MTDIVERAREGLCEPNVVCEDCRMLREAIDEIERLRAALQEIADMSADDDGYHAVQMAKEALGDN